MLCIVYVCACVCVCVRAVRICLNGAVPSRRRKEQEEELQLLSISDPISSIQILDSAVRMCARVCSMFVYVFVCMCVRVCVCVCVCVCARAVV